MRSLGIDAFQTHHQVIKSQTWLEEVLAINDFLIAATLVPTVCDRVMRVSAKHERTIRHEHIAPVIPDGWIVFHITETTPVAIWLEMDMGTEQEAFFRRKIVRIIDFSNNGYEQAFGTASVIVAVATRAGDKRRQSLLTWIEKEVDYQHEPEARSIFRVTSLAPGALDPTTLFLAPVWYIPYRRHKGIYQLEPLIPVVS